MTRCSTRIVRIARPCSQKKGAWRRPEPDMHPMAGTLPALDDAAGRQIVLRDGWVAAVRHSTPADAEALEVFFRDLSAQSRYRRFFTAGNPTADLISRLSDST